MLTQQSNGKHNTWMWSTDKWTNLSCDYFPHTGIIATCGGVFRKRDPRSYETANRAANLVMIGGRRVSYSRISILLNLAQYPNPIWPMEGDTMVRGKVRVFDSRFSRFAFADHGSRFRDVRCGGGTNLYVDRVYRVASALTAYICVYTALTTYIMMTCINKHNWLPRLFFILGRFSFRNVTYWTV